MRDAKYKKYRIVVNNYYYYKNNIYRVSNNSRDNARVEQTLRQNVSDNKFELLIFLLLTP